MPKEMKNINYEPIVYLAMVISPYVYLSWSAQFGYMSFNKTMSVVVLCLFLLLGLVSAIQVWRNKHPLAFRIAVLPPTGISFLFLVYLVSSYYEYYFSSSGT